MPKHSLLRPKVGILMGSDSDLEVMRETENRLDYFGIPYEVRVLSAHRSPAKTLEYADSAHQRGIEVIIVGAGAAAHLAGVVASKTTLPVIGIPLDSSALRGMDALLATVQMPSGVPVATMAIGKAGAANAGIFAAQILARKDHQISARLLRFKEEMISGVEQKNRKLRSQSKRKR
ncbi:MAG: 5-(carboxyamino)imidazole ribonucleotide mutase [Deltaproteobacteria bacterium]|nr:5-(carboxyamino)imidazole ribonucleotide mutase [Deltaproteobacteria bacterium]